MSGKTPDVARCAQLLGMKPSEVVDVQLDADGTLAQTHDGNWTLVRDGGVLEFLGQDAGLASGGVIKGPPVLVGEREPEEVIVPADVKPAPKGRGRS